MKLDKTCYNLRYISTSQMRNIVFSRRERTKSKRIEKLNSRKNKRRRKKNSFFCPLSSNKTRHLTRSCDSRPLEETNYSVYRRLSRKRSFDIFAIRLSIDSNRFDSWEAHDERLLARASLTDSRAIARVTFRCLIIIPR